MARRQIGQEVLMFGDPVSERSRRLDWAAIDTAFSPIYALRESKVGWLPLGTVQGPAALSDMRRTS